jgi:5-methylcytosine-specific restriction endonuclease McrA
VVFVLDTTGKPLSPCRPARARRLLTSGKAAVWRRYPFTIILQRAVLDAQPEPLRLKLDPGSRTTGLALVNDATGQVVWATEVARLQRSVSVRAISQELVRFDTQLLEQPEISGVEYQQGELAGYEVREYLLELWGRRCAYCGATRVPLQIEHLVPKARGGTNRVSNLTLACGPCNTAKGTQTAAEFGHPEVHAQAQRPLKDAAAVNTTRWALYRRLQATGLPVEVGTGGRTKWNRTRRGLPKAHWIDAACVGTSTPEHLRASGVVPLRIAATGRESRQMCRMDRYGFPRNSTKGTRRIQGFQTGGLVRAVVPSGARSGTHVGRVAVRARGAFNMRTAVGTVTDIAVRYCRLLQHPDGYAYGFIPENGGAALPLAD